MPGVHKLYVGHSGHIGSVPNLAGRNKSNDQSTFFLCPHHIIKCQRGDKRVEIFWIASMDVERNAGRFGLPSPPHAQTC